MYNKVIMVGHLTRDIEVRYTQGALAIANTALATSRKFKSPTGEQKEETCFVDITFFGRSAEVAKQYLKKGSKILVEGRLNFEQWSDQNGAKRSKHTIIVETMQMLDSKNSPTTEIPRTQAEKPPYPKQDAKQPQNEDEYNPFDDGEEAPF